MPGSSQGGGKPENDSKVYFEWGVVILLVEHAADLAAETVTKRLKSYLMDAAGQLLGKLGGRLDFDGIDERRTFTFQHLNRAALHAAPSHLQRAMEARDQEPERTPKDEAFSLVRVPLKGPKKGRGHGPDKKSISNKLLIRLVQAANQNLAAQEWVAEAGDGLKLRAVSPNWLNTPTPDVAGGGGPGARPVPVDLPKIQELTDAWSRRAGSAPPNFDGLPFGFKFSDPKLSGTGTPGAGLIPEVVILDTAPSQEQLRAAEAEFVTNKGTQPLLQSLLSSGQFTITPAPESELPPQGEVFVEYHDYPMNDHGLFVAGIIHSIVPDVPIRLIQVLNEHGVGYVDYIESVIRQIIEERALIRQAGQSLAPLLINCSLVLVMPLPGHAKKSEGYDDDLIDSISDEDRDDEEILEEGTVLASGSNLVALSEAVLGASPEERQILAQINVLGTALEWVMDAARNQDVMVVASAGNDGQAYIGGVPSSLRAQARLPAAFPTVVGVGALDKQGNSSSFSNRADRQPWQGLAVFGGAEEPGAPPLGGSTSTGPVADPPAPMTKAGEALLGIYTGQFPDNSKQPSLSPNDNGWAYWAGTSFAAPVITGALARLIRNGGAATLDEAHEILINSKSGFTPEGDEVLQVHQGP